jgi:peptidyl-prolyl cis-trans isomerase A (cyclophilin A)
MHLRRTVLALAAATLACAAPSSPAWAQPPNPRVVITTAQGTITVELAADKAPITAANFLKYVDRKLFDGATFYRASKPPGQAANDYGTIQGGLQNDPKKVLPPIAHESTLKTGLKHTDGTISMGRHAPGTAQADWFICIGDMSYLDADPKDPKNPGFAAFGHVVDGMPVAQAILGMPTDPNAGVGAMKGEMLLKPVRILSIRRAPPAAPAAPTAAVSPAPT